MITAQIPSDNPGGVLMIPPETAALVAAMTKANSSVPDAWALDHYALNGAVVSYSLRREAMGREEGRVDAGSTVVSGR